MAVSHCIDTAHAKVASKVGDMVWMDDSERWYFRSAPHVFVGIVCTCLPAPSEPAHIPAHTRGCPVRRWHYSTIILPDLE